MLTVLQTLSAITRRTSRKWWMLPTGLVAILIIVAFYLSLFPTKTQVMQSYQLAVANKNFRKAFGYVQQQPSEGITWNNYNNWKNSFPDDNIPIEVQKVPMFESVPFFRIWRVILPTRHITVALPFSELPITIDSVPYISSSKSITIPLFVGTHRLQCNISGAANETQILHVDKALDGTQQSQTISVTVQPSATLLNTVKTFLTNYNQSWCNAVNSRKAEGILPYLSGKSSSEYSFITQYIGSLNKQNWMKDTETLKQLDTTQVRFEDATHLQVHTTEIYHHDTHILQNHDNWLLGARKEYDDTVKWIYEIKLLNSNQLQIESLNHPAQG